MSRKIIALTFMILALILGVVFFKQIRFPASLEGYFRPEYYNQFGPMAICVELLVSGLYLFISHRKANFALALFGFTVFLDIFFNAIGFISSLVPLYATTLFAFSAVMALWLAFTNTFNLGRISLWAALGSFILGNAIELFFNYW